MSTSNIFNNLELRDGRRWHYNKYLAGTISSIAISAQESDFGLQQHLLDFIHNDIAHENRTSLDAVQGVNTGDQYIPTGLTELTNDTGFISSLDGFTTDNHPNHQQIVKSHIRFARSKYIKLKKNNINNYN